MRSDSNVITERCITVILSYSFRCRYIRGLAAEKMETLRGVDAHKAPLVMSLIRSGLNCSKIKIMCAG